MKKIALLTMILAVTVVAQATVNTPPAYKLYTSISNLGTGSGNISVIKSDKSQSPLFTQSGVTSTSTLIEKGSYITITASANTGSEFGGWGGDCSGKGACQLKMNENKSVTAKFNIKSIKLTPAELQAASSTCAKAALTKRDATVIPALQKYTADWIVSMNTRSDKQKLAYDKTGTERLSLIRQSRIDAKKTQISITKTLSIVKANANAIYSNELKACGFLDNGKDE